MDQFPCMYMCVYIYIQNTIFSWIWMIQIAILSPKSIWPASQCKKRSCNWIHVAPKLTQSRRILLASEANFTACILKWRNYQKINNFLLGPSPLVSPKHQWPVISMDFTVPIGFGLFKFNCNECSIKICGPPNEYTTCTVFQWNNPIDFRKMSMKDKKKLQRSKSWRNSLFHSRN